MTKMREIPTIFPLILPETGIPPPAPPGRSPAVELDGEDRLRSAAVGAADTCTAPGDWRGRTGHDIDLDILGIDSGGLARRPHRPARARRPSSGPPRG
jgi:hypothetical protein